MGGYNVECDSSDLFTFIVLKKRVIHEVHYLFLLWLYIQRIIQKESVIDAIGGKEYLRNRITYLNRFKRHYKDNKEYYKIKK